MCEIYRAVYFPQQMIGRHEILYTEYFYLFAVLSTLYYHFHHRFYYTTKQKHLLARMFLRGREGTRPPVREAKRKF